MIMYEWFEPWDPRDVPAIRRLCAQLMSVPLKEARCSSSALRDMFHRKDTHMAAARDAQTRRIVGMATLVIVRIPTGIKAHIEDVVVHRAHRGEGIGRELMNMLIGRARKLGARYVDLTSRPSRTAAHALYRSLGYEERDTRVYRLRLL